jgi:DNA-binding beta-propeller fold protein YncE
MAKEQKAKFATPWGITVDRRGAVYVADMYNYRVRKIAPDGTVTTLAGSGEKGSADGVSAQAKFDEPCGVAVDRSGNVYVLDGWELPLRGPKVRVRKIDPRGFVTTLVGASK